MLRRGRTHPHPELIDRTTNWCIECEQYAAFKWLCPVCLDRAKRDRQFASRAGRRIHDREHAPAD